MFGVVAIATVVLVGLSMFSDIGLGQVIVRSQRGDEAVFTNTVWTTQIARGSLLCLVGLLVSAGLAVGSANGLFASGSVYADPTLPGVVAALSTTALIEGFVSTKGAQSRRNVQLAKITQLDIASQLFGLACMFVWIYFDRSIWALVFGAIGGSVAKAILTHVWLDGHQNRFRWSRRAFVEIFEFGKWIFLSSILGFLVSNADRLLLGGFVDARTLGVYSIAFTLASALDLVMSKLINAVAFPAFSEIVRDRPEKLRQVYYKVFSSIAAVCYLMCGFLVVVGQSLVNLLYDHRYSEAGWMLQILICGAVAVPYQVGVQCFLALGKPHLFTQVLLGRLVALVAALAIGFNLAGLSGALWGIVASQILPVCVIVFWLARLRIYDLKREAILLVAIPAGVLGGVGMLWSAHFFNLQ